MTATTDLAAALPVNSIKFRLDVGQELSGKGSGDLIAADLRPARWLAQINSSEMTHAQLASVQALIDQLDGAISTFLLWDASKAYPAADLDGAIIGSSAVKIKSVGSNTKSLALKGLPVGYVLTRGDLLQVNYASPSTRIALHRVIAATVTADSSGETSEFEVRPYIVTGMAADDVVNLKKPAAEFKIMPGSYDPNAAVASGTLSFQAMQKR